MPRRPGAALAALALLAAALAAPACKPSSLTPGFIGTRGQEDTGAATVISGLWLGSTSNSGQLRFQVSDLQIADMVLEGEGPCGRRFARPDRLQLEGGLSFALTFELDSGGFFAWEGTFVSPTTCVGSYTYSGVAPISGCPATAGGTFTATVSR